MSSGPGRPKKEDAKWNPIFCDRIIDHMSKGYSLESFTAEAKVTRDMLYKWQIRYPEFKAACDIGAGLSRKFWEQMGINGCAGKLKNFSAAVWIFTMKCRFGYRDGTETGAQTDTREASNKIFKTQWRQIENKAKQELNEEKK